MSFDLTLQPIKVRNEKRSRVLLITITGLGHVAGNIPSNFELSIFEALFAGPPSLLKSPYKMLASATMPTTTPAIPELPPRSKEGDHPADPLTRQPPLNPQLAILYHEPDRYIVITKPADVRIDGSFTHTVEKLLLSHHTPREQIFPRFVHRLDYATSGVLLIALTRVTASIAAAQFEKKTVVKVYLALVHGRLDRDITIDQPIADSPGSFRMVVGDGNNPGRASVTECHPICNGFYNGSPVTKVRLFPRTGRRHQLRVHLAYAGFPIVGDATYVEENDWLAPRMMLHAQRLEIGLPKGVVYGRKSASRNLERKVFDAGDCFADMDGLVLDT